MKAVLNFMGKHTLLNIIFLRTEAIKICMVVCTGNPCIDMHGITMAYYPI